MIGILGSRWIRIFILRSFQVLIDLSRHWQQSDICDKLKHQKGYLEVLIAPGVNRYSNLQTEDKQNLNGKFRCTEQPHKQTDHVDQKNPKPHFAYSATWHLANRAQTSCTLYPLGQPSRPVYPFDWHYNFYDLVKTTLWLSAIFKSVVAPFILD